MSKKFILLTALLLLSIVLMPACSGGATTPQTEAPAQDTETPAEETPQTEAPAQDTETPACGTSRGRRTASG